MRYQYTPEKYNRGRGRYTCPSCKHPKEFARYVDTRTGSCLANEVGRCNRELKCGYHFTPRQFFQENPSYTARKTNTRRLHKDDSQNLTPTSFITARVLRETLGGYSTNNLVTFLRSHFSDIHVSSVVRRYLIGTSPDMRTVFWQIDTLGRIHTGKLMLYDAATGKRVKTRRPSWVHAELKRSGELSCNYRLRQCFFGEHLLTSKIQTTIGLVESEKTAIVASLFLPNYLWLATGGCGNLDLARLSQLEKGRRVVLFPDSSKFDAWSIKASKAKKLLGTSVKVSDLLERRLTDEQKSEDYDIADFLLRQDIPQSTTPFDQM